MISKVLASEHAVSQSSRLWTQEGNETQVKPIRTQVKEKLKTNVYLNFYRKYQERLGNLKQMDKIT